MGEEEKGRGPTADPWESGFPVQGAGWLMVGEGECASCKLAFEGVVSEACEFQDKESIVTPLTLGLVGV